MEQSELDRAAVADSYANTPKSSEYETDHQMNVLSFKRGAIWQKDRIIKLLEHQAEIDESETGPNWKPDNAKYAKCIRNLIKDIEEIDL